MKHLSAAWCASEDNDCHGVLYAALSYCWGLTQQLAQSEVTVSATHLLWNFTENMYHSQFVHLQAYTTMYYVQTAKQAKNALKFPVKAEIICKKSLFPRQLLKYISVSLL